MSLSGDDIAEVVVPAVDREAASTRKFLAFQHRRTGLDVYRDSTVRVEGGLMCVDVPHRGVIYERRALCALVAENPTAFPEYLPRSSSASRALMCCALTKAGANCTNKYGGNGHTCNVHGAHGVSALLVDNDSRPMSSACMDCSLGAQLSSGAVYRCCTCSRWAHAPTDTHPGCVLGCPALAARQISLGLCLDCHKDRPALPVLLPLSLVDGNLPHLTLLSAAAFDAAPPPTRTSSPSVATDGLLPGFSPAVVAELAPPAASPALVFGSVAVGVGPPSVAVASLGAPAVATPSDDSAVPELALGAPQAPLLLSRNSRGDENRVMFGSALAAARNNTSGMVGMRQELAAAAQAAAAASSRTVLAPLVAARGDAAAPAGRPVVVDLSAVETPGPRAAVSGTDPAAGAVAPAAAFVAPPLVAPAAAPHGSRSARDEAEAELAAWKARHEIEAKRSAARGRLLEERLAAVGAPATPPVLTGLSAGPVLAPGAPPLLPSAPADPPAVSLQGVPADELKAFLMGIVTTANEDRAAASEDRATQRELIARMERLVSGHDPAAWPASPAARELPLYHQPGATHHQAAARELPMYHQPGATHHQPVAVDGGGARARTLTDQYSADFSYPSDHEFFGENYDGTATGKGHAERLRFVAEGASKITELLCTDILSRRDARQFLSLDGDRISVSRNGGTAAKHGTHAQHVEYFRLLYRHNEERSDPRLFSAKSCAIRRERLAVISYLSHHFSRIYHAPGKDLAQALAFLYAGAKFYSGRVFNPAHNGPDYALLNGRRGAWDDLPVWPAIDSRALAMLPTLQLQLGLATVGATGQSATVPGGAPAPAGRFCVLCGSGAHSLDGHPAGAPITKACRCGHLHTKNGPLRTDCTEPECNCKMNSAATDAARVRRLQAQ